MEANYNSGNTTISKYVSFDMFETLNKIDAYINSVHISGSQDSIGRDKPFFNIVTAARNIWYRATDIDRKNIRVKATTLGHYTLAFVADMLLKNWMKKTGFGAVLNEWGRTLATYCSAVMKFVEKNGELHVSVIPWSRIICDPIDFDANPVIEVLEFTPAQLRKQGYDEDKVEVLLQNLTSREDLAKQPRDNKAEYIKVYEIHGELPKSFMTGNEEDEDKYTQQVHIISFIEKKNGGRGNFRANYEDFTLFKGNEKKSPYFKTDLIKEDGRTLGIGAVENLFEAQWMTNHSAKLVKDTLDFASLLILQTSDGTLVGRNVLQSLVTGDVLVHSKDEPLTQLNNTHDISQIQAFAAQWQNVAKEITSTPDAIRGNTQPSGTAYRLQQLNNNESHSLFELMRENKGLAIEYMHREYILPYLKTQMNTSDEISAVLDTQGINQFDSMYIPSEAVRRSNRKIIDTVLSGEIAEQPDMNELESEVKGELAPLGNHRFIKPSDVSDQTWKQVLKDFEWQVEVDPTQESEDVNEALTTLSSTLQTVVGLAGRPMTPDERLIFNQIMEKAGSVSPLQLTQHTNQPSNQQAVSNADLSQLTKQPIKV